MSISWTNWASRRGPSILWIAVIAISQDSNKINQVSAFFVTRAKNNFSRKRLYSLPVDKSTGIQCEKRLPGKTPPYPLLRFKEKQNACVSDQQLPPTRQNDCRPLSFPLAGGTVFQMDQAASPDQGILRHNRKRREDSDLDRHFHLCPRRHREENLETRSKSLHNSASAECFSFWENAHLSGAFKYYIHKSGLLY